MDNVKRNALWIINNRGVIPKLDAPGAGLPWLQEWLLKYIEFPLLKRMVSWGKALDVFEKEGKDALRVAKEVPEELRRQQVLVPCMLGIEDSSRYWSMAMFMEHMMIVSHGVAGLMKKLSDNEQIDTVVDTATVKPGLDRQEDIERKFNVFINRFSKKINVSVAERETQRCHVHPWFGCLNPHGWVVMLAVHQWIHKRQMRQIRNLILAQRY